LQDRGNRPVASRAHKRKGFLDCGTQTLLQIVAEHGARAMQTSLDGLFRQFQTLSRFRRGDAFNVA
jgi:hypothetical protein